MRPMDTGDQILPKDPAANNSDEQNVGNNKGKPQYIAAVGASAGGLEALERFFSVMPDNTGMAFVVVQHLSPDFKSLMGELLARWTKMKIHRVTNGMEIELNSIYLMPPMKEMIISGGRLLLTDKEANSGLTLPIDQFFRSLAQDYGPQAIAVVLSGTGSDGSRGVCDISQQGGFVCVQSEETAKFDGMPRSAIETGVVDVVLPPEEIPQALLRHIKHPAALEESTDGPGSENDMDGLFRLLRDAYNIDFSYYKPTTVVRRTERRLQINHVSKLSEYLERVRNDPDELDALYRDLLIGVTGFFRDREAFECLEKQIIPELVAEVPPDRELRAWVAACATGEEAYSLAILLREEMERQNRPVLVKIFATDVHRTSLDLASAGIYEEAALADMTAERRERYFVKNGKSYQVIGDLRQMVVFAPHNITKDAPFTKLDMITCRNLLIYLQPVAQKKALSLFHFGLKTGGILFLGPSESPGELAGEFDVLEQHWKIYRKRRDIRLPADMRLPLSTGVGGQMRAPAAPQMQATVGADPHMVGLFSQLLEEALPPSLLVNDQNELMHSFGNAGRFLKLKRGRPSWDVLDMLEGDFRLAVAGALQRAAKEQISVNFSGITVETSAGSEVIGLRVRPVYVPRVSAPFFLISLTTREEAEVGREIESPVDLAEVSRDRVESLESELRYTKENLQATIEELETSNEELQAANQELLASNEELQSTNEELHSVNEELYTVNAEYQKKIAELTELNADMDNLLESTNIHTIFLDNDLRIRKFTPKIAETFNLLPQDVGRRIESFTHNIKHDALARDLHRVLDTGKIVEREVQGPYGSWFLVRILPYYKQTVSDGVVLTLIDITQRKKTMRRLREMDAQFQEIIDRSQTLIYVKELHGTYSMLNRSFEMLAGIPHDEMMGKSDFEIFDEATAERVRRNDEAVIASGKSAESEEVLPHAEGPRTYLSTRFPLRDEDGNVRAVGGIRTDVTRLKEIENRAREAVMQRDRFLAILSHELRNPLGAILNAVTVLERQASRGVCVTPPLSVIKRQGRQMAVLLNDLLDVGRITQGKIHIRRQIVDVNEVAQAAVDTVRAQAEAHKHRLELVVSDEPSLVDADKARLTQVFENLLTNAIKYTLDGGEIGLRVEADEGEVLVRVSDTGRGIPSSMVDTIFEMFVQSDNTLDRTDGGMGVGLTLVRELVHLHGGSVKAVSDGPGKGAVFVVRLPRVKDVAKESANPEQDDPQARLKKRLHVLIVEDNDDSREMLQALLEFEGYHVSSAEEGHQGLARILEQKPDVALVDIGLPGLDGYQIAKQVRASLSSDKVQLVALTGYGREEDRKAVFEAGFDEHLVKPINTTQLNRVLAGKSGVVKMQTEESG